MRLFRFMSKNEFNKYLNGETLENTTVHNGRTNSIGFCFFDTENFSPIFAYEFISGIVDKDVCAVFETEIELKKGYGIYADQYSSWSWDTLIVDEYSTTKYNNKIFKLLKYHTKVDKKDWENDLGWTIND